MTTVPFIVAFAGYVAVIIAALYFASMVQQRVSRSIDRARGFHPPEETGLGFIAGVLVAGGITLGLLYLFGV